MTRRQIAGLRAVVTGASSGIGLALSRELSRQGARLIVTARREQRLRELVAELASDGHDVIPISGDITDAALRNQLLQTAATRLGGLDLLVNNAGVGALGPFAQADPSRLRRIMEVNFFGPVELTRELLPMLRLGHKPLIVNICSVLGHRAVPNKSEYCASKFALHGFSDALRAELAPWGVDVLLVSPSTTQSEFFDSVIEKVGPKLDAGARLEGTLDTASDPGVLSRAAEPDAAAESLGHTAGQPTAGHPDPDPRGMSSLAVARQIVRAIRSGRHEVILSPGGKLLVWLDRLCPPLMNRLVARFGAR